MTMPPSSQDDAPGGPGPEEAIDRLAQVLGAALVGHDALIERLLIAVLAGGHVLIEGAPGLAKTRAVRALAAGIDAGFARIQCTPDLLPSDLTGTTILGPGGGFVFSEGPVFHNLVLVDEINRAPPKVQSALLEAMAERQVTTSGVTRPLPNPFMVVATQNPIEHEGTFPLPEAQLDRFLLHVVLDLPDAAAERGILDLMEAGGETLALAGTPICTTDLLAAREAAARVHLSDLLRDYIVRLVMASRLPPLRRDIAHPVSPRGTLAAAKARAFILRRDHALPEDVQAVAMDALSHRLVPTWTAQADGVGRRMLVERMLGAVEAL
ncbi:AAA family ATPase [Profundibacterium mesophilum]|uniref:MoxR-like ATPase n=1 Tax=Profundibacterium mesophilum KAUST100406-0324 TaxID=1037889 RepID=A0A921NW85_9RHOB|nr:AAA family ATPase [Profundibacterium mesophilum]KAF0674693.1 MoxR-like ATPase [Profundibacterium mesophilum KAUST100406-0324]